MIERLIEELERIWRDDTLLLRTDKGSKRYFNTKKVNTVETLACNVLIFDNGGCNWENINKLRSLGWHVYAGERDSFGWLTGVIEKDNKLFFYG